jgi:two-component sensor histidine kinase
VTSAQTWDLSYQPREILSADPDIAADAGVTCGRHSQLTLTPALESAKLARDFTRDTLLSWKLDTLINDAVIIASELVTNAIRHGVDAAAEAGRVELAWQRHASRLICVVTDRSALPPVLAATDPNAECGRGLQVVQALAAAWGWMMLGAQEKAVWAALLLPVCK